MGLKQYSNYTKYYGELEGDNADPVMLEFAKATMQTRLLVSIAAAGEDPAGFDVEMLVYQSYEDDAATGDTPQSTMGAVYFPEPIFTNSIPVILVGCRAAQRAEVALA